MFLLSLNVILITRMDKDPICRKWFLQPQTLSLWTKKANLILFMEHGQKVATDTHGTGSALKLGSQSNQMKDNSIENTAGGGST